MLGDELELYSNSCSPRAGDRVLVVQRRLAEVAGGPGLALTGVVPDLADLAEDVRRCHDESTKAGNVSKHKTQPIYKNMRRMLIL